MASLIPGLPNDLALQCLMRLPDLELPRMKRVSSLWNIAISSHRFYIQRRRSFPFPSIFIVKEQIGDRFEFLDCDLAGLSSPPRYLLSCDKSFFPSNVIFAPALNCILALSPGAVVQRLSILSWRWTHLGRSIPSWCKIKFASLKCLLFVVMYDVGSDNVEDERHDTICDVYNSENDSWCTVQGLPQKFDCQNSFTCQDRVYTRGFSVGDMQTSVYAFNPQKKLWEYDSNMTTKMNGLEHGENIQVVARPDGTILCAFQHRGSINLVQQRTVSSVNELNMLQDRHEWINVLILRFDKAYALIAKGNQIVLLVSDPRKSWICRQIPFCNGGLCIRVSDVKFQALLLDV